MRPTDLRHAAARRMVLEDEKLHSSAYSREEESEETSVRHW